MEKQNLANYHLKGHYNNLVLLLKGPEDLWGTDYETNCPALSKPSIWQILSRSKNAQA